jgi:hypothetical protein
MNFLTVFLRSIAFVPGVVQGVEALYGAKAGDQKKDAAIAMVGSAINIADAVSNKQIADAGKFTGGLTMIVDGVVECLNASLWAKST